MALNAAVDPIATSFILKDNNNLLSTMGFYLPAGTPLADVQSYFTATRAPLLGLTNAQLQGANASIAYVEDAPVTPIDVSSEVERKLVLIFGTGSRRQKVRIEVPSPVFALESPGTNQVALDNPLVVAFANQIISGAIGANNGAVSVSGAQITRLEKAYIAHRGRGDRTS